ncbi:ADP-ribosylglycohydrolase-domain-containing protein [Mycena latifolia]|nr:ADP-ribosylglycohydrolase-domain-containing protein [Mycena latifolia]
MPPDSSDIDPFSTLRILRYGAGGRFSDFSMQHYEAQHIPVLCLPRRSISLPLLDSLYRHLLPFTHCSHAMPAPPLHLQPLVAAAPSTKIRLALLATALCDALGGPAEFRARFSFDFLSHMVPNENFELPAGVWTDDTSMALALAHSIATFTEDSEAGVTKGRGGFDEEDQLDAYYRWWQDGALSATGHCFDIGNTIQRALALYRDALNTGGHAQGKNALRRVGAALSLSAGGAKAKEREGRRAAAGTALMRIGRDLKGSVFGGNGSLMRVIPVGLAYWRDENAAADYAVRSSMTTHPNPVCGEACAAWTRCVARVVKDASAAGPRRMTKLDVLHHFATYPYAADALRKALVADVPFLATAADDPAAMEEHYAVHHPLMRLRTAALQAAPDGAGPEETDDALAERILALLPTAEALPSSGYVVHTLVAALYTFLATQTFADGAMLVANMGNDADTVAAVYGGLAGAWYAGEEKQGDSDSLFWSPRVREWRSALVRRDMVEEVAEELVAFAEKQ